MSAVMPLLTASWGWLGLTTSRALDGLGLLIEIVIEGPDLCASLFAWLVLFMIGNQLTNAIPDVRRRSGHLALGVFLVYAGRKFVIEFPADAADVLSIVLRSLWAAAWVFVLALILFTVFAGIWQHTFGILGCLLLQSFRRAQKTYSEARRRMTDSERLERLRDNAERLAPERERLAREAEARAEAEAQVKLAAQKRREDARAACELAYALAAPEIAERFSKQDFAEFATKYMTDKFPPESVEERAEQLKAIIRQHQEKVVPTPKFRSIQELAVWFEERKAEIEAVSDARHRATLLVQLKERYSELTSQLLTEMTP